MRMAHSLGSVYRKLQTDKNIHNDRHYLVAVTEHLKVGSCSLGYLVVILVEFWVLLVLEYL